MLPLVEAQGSALSLQIQLPNTSWRPLGLFLEPITVPSSSLSFMLALGSGSPPLT